MEKTLHTSLNNMQKGFIQIPILIAILIGTAILGGTSYIAYETGKKSSMDIPEPIVSTNTASTSVQLVATTSVDVNATTTDSVNVTTITENVETSVKSAISTEVSTPPVENFNEVIIAFIDSRLDYERQVIDYIDEFVDYSERYYKMVSNMRYEMEEISGNSDEDELFINFISSHVNQAKVFYDGFQGLVDRLNADVTYYQGQRSLYLNKFVTREQSITLSKQISDLSKANEYFDFSGDFFDDLTDAKDKFDSEMEMIFALQEAKYDSVSSYTPSYIPAPTPQVQKPSVTSTSCSIHGNTMYCDTYQNLY